ncbi:MAG: 23S rRNA (uracil(1939)-C(5))-methyltransferase RlmD [Clostridia bacterium]|nr:23S rRNA (uracil(1939)-C(5))-methyltransferase RlmD [Clostridia bacterium]
MKKNDVLTLKITGWTHDGYGVARSEDGMAIFIPGTAVGDVAEIRVVKLLSNRAIGKVERLLTPSTDRTENDCPAFPACGGCNYRHITYAAESALKRDRILTTLQKLGGVQIDAIDYYPAEETDGYRNKAVFPVAPDAQGKAICGFYRANSHRIVTCDDCRIHPPVFSAIAAAVCRFMNDFGIAPYDEATKQGIVRSIFVRRGEVSGQIMVCINAAKRRLRESDKLITYLKAVAPELTSVMLSYQPEANNKLIGDKVFCLWGESAITDTLAGNELMLSPHTFYQVNHAQCERLYAQILAYAAECGALEGLKVLDLFCGAGSITLALARKAGQVLGIECVADAVRDAQNNAARNGLNNAEFICADAKYTAELCRERGFVPDLVVVDPPRKGLAEEVCGYLADLDVQNVVYVSCDPATLARDVRRLSECGFAVKKVSGYDLFPRTANVETICLLSRE